MAAPAITTEVQICNLALSQLGQSPIASIETPTTTAETVCSLHFAQTRKEVLRSHVFNFSKKLSTLTVDATKTPAFGFTYAYALPNDFVRLLALGDISLDDDIDHKEYEISDGYIFTDYEDGGTLNITYVYNCTTVTKYDALFTKLLYLQLASDVAYAFTAKPSMIRQLEDRLQQAEIKAAAVAGQEKKPRRIERSYWKRRRLGGSRIDNTHWSY